MPTPRPVVLTRPAGRNHSLAARLHPHGITTLELPALAVATLPCDAQTLPRPEHYDLVVFVSGTAARAYAEQLRHSAHLHRWPAQVAAACVGPTSARSLRGDFWPPTTRILHPPASAPRHDSEALWCTLQPHLPGIGRALIVRSTTGRDWLTEKLRAAGVTVAHHAAYQRSAADWPEAARATLARWHAARHDAHLHPVWLATSGESLTAIHAQMAQAGWLPWWRGHGFVLTHPRLAERLAALLQTPPAALHLRVCTPDAAATVRALRELSRAA